jgi:hypothetical protein
MASYTFADVMRITGANKSEMTHWTREEIVRADVAPGGGPGRHRKFSFLNLLEASIAVELNRLSAPVYVIRNLVSYVRWLEMEGCRDPEAPRRYIKDLLAHAASMRGASTGRKPTGKKLKTFTKAEMDRILERTLDVQKHLLDDTQAWFIYRHPLPSWRDKYSWIGLTYSFEAGAHVRFADLFGEVLDEWRRHGGVHHTSLILVPKGKSVSLDLYGRAAVVVSLGGILADLEKRTGDSLIQ